MVAAASQLLPRLHVNLWRKTQREDVEGMMEILRELEVMIPVAVGIEIVEEPSLYLALRPMVLEDDLEVPMVLGDGQEVLVTIGRSNNANQVSHIL